MVAERERRVVGGAVNLDGALGVTAGAEEEEIEGEAGEEGDEALGVGAVAVDGLLGVAAGVTAEAAVTDELGVPVEYVTFFTTLCWSSEK